MDWSRSKTILILSFFLLNMMLAYELWANKLNLTKSNLETAGIAEELNRLMRSKDIQIESDIPKEVPKLKEIVVESDKEFKPNEKMTLDKPIEYSRFLGRAMPKDPITKLIEKADMYELDPISSSEEVIVLNQMYGALPIFDVNLELFYQNGEITAYRQAYVEIESGADQKEQKVIPAHTAVRSLVENFLPAGSVIKDIHLGYHGRFFYSDKQLLLPSWRVAVASGGVYYVNAFNGAAEVPQKLKKPDESTGKK